MTLDVFYDWFRDFILSQVKEQTFLVLDSNDLHLSLDLVKLAWGKNFTTLKLPVSRHPMFCSLFTRLFTNGWNHSWAEAHEPFFKNHFKHTLCMHFVRKVYHQGWKFSWKSQEWYRVLSWKLSGYFKVDVELGKIYLFNILIDDMTACPWIILYGWLCVAMLFDLCYCMDE